MPERGVVNLNHRQRSTLSAYLDELERWNPRVNLTSVPATEAWRRHVEESARLLDAADPATYATAVDVGSGAGVPGIVVAILRSDLLVTLLEADARKAAFLDHVAGMLGLGNVRVDPRRAEQAGRDPAFRESFDLALSRAAAEPPALCELSLPLIRVGGRLCALVTDAAAAASACKAAATALGGGEPRAKGTSVLVVPKIASTDARYPRRSGVPTRHPIL